MTAAALEHDSAHAPEAHHTSLPINSRKLAMWVFIASECLLFASLITTFVIYRNSHATGPGPKDVFEVPLVTAGTAVLLFSSFFIVMALNGAQSGDRKKLMMWLSLTVFCGLFFVGMQVYEFTHFYHEGLTMQKNLFGASFFTLTGFHGTHVTIGVIWLITIFIEGLKGHVPPAKALNFEMAALYWHFVDVVWIVIFPVVYLMNS